MLNLDQFIEFLSGETGVHRQELLAEAMRDSAIVKQALERRGPREGHGQGHSGRYDLFSLADPDDPEGRLPPKFKTPPHNHKMWR